MRYLSIFANESVKLIQKDYVYNCQGIQQAYKYILHKYGYASTKGKIDQKSLAEQFRHYYGDELLELLQSSIDTENDSTWLKFITRKHRKSFHPIRHLLFIHFFNENLDTFYRYASESYYPFNQAPYPCLNPATEHYYKPVIYDIEVTRDSKTGQPVGTFKCSCGFVYSRRGPDKNEKDRYKIGRIKQFEEIWKKKLYQLIHRKKLSYSAAAKVLKIDRSTVKKYEKEKVITYEFQQGEYLQDLINQQRNHWLQLQNVYPNAIKTQLRKKSPALYMWLYRNDKQWLDDNSPIKAIKQSINNRVNWTDRDSKILDDVKDAVRKLLSSEKPIHLNLSRIGKESGHLGILQKHLAKLPRTKEYLDGLIETTEEFQMRRIQWAVNELTQKGEDILEWRVKRLAGLGSRISENIQEQIEVCIKTFR